MSSPIQTDHDIRVQHLREEGISVFKELILKSYGPQNGKSFIAMLESENKDVVDHFMTGIIVGVYMTRLLEKQDPVIDVWPAISSLVSKARHHLSLDQRSMQEYLSSSSENN